MKKVELIALGEKKKKEEIPEMNENLLEKILKEENKEEMILEMIEYLKKTNGNIQVQKYYFIILSYLTEKEIGMFLNIRNSLIQILYHNKRNVSLSLLLLKMIFQISQDITIELMKCYLIDSLNERLWVDHEYIKDYNLLILNKIEMTQMYPFIISNQSKLKNSLKLFELFLNNKNIRIYCIQNIENWINNNPTLIKNIFELFSFIILELKKDLDLETFQFILELKLKSNYQNQYIELLIPLMNIIEYSKISLKYWIQNNNFKIFHSLFKYIKEKSLSFIFRELNEIKIKKLLKNIYQEIDLYELIIHLTDDLELILQIISNYLSNLSIQQDQSIRNILFKIQKYLLSIQYHENILFLKSLDHFNEQELYLFNYWSHLLPFDQELYQILLEKNLNQDYFIDLIKKLIYRACILKQKILPNINTIPFNNIDLLLSFNHFELNYFILMIGCFNPINIGIKLYQIDLYKNWIEKLIKNEIDENMKIFQELNLCQEFRNTREPDYLLDILSREGIDESLKWILNIIDTIDLNILPISILCEILIRKYHESILLKLKYSLFHHLDESYQIIIFFIEKNRNYLKLLIDDLWIFQLPNIISWIKLKEDIYSIFIKLLEKDHDIDFITLWIDFLSNFHSSFELMIPISQSILNRNDFSLKLFQYKPFHLLIQKLFLESFQFINSNEFLFIQENYDLILLITHFKKEEEIHYTIPSLYFNAFTFFILNSSFEFLSSFKDLIHILIKNGNQIEKNQERRDLFHSSFIISLILSNDKDLIDLGLSKLNKNDYHLFLGKYGISKYAMNHLNLLNNNIINNNNQEFKEFEEFKEFKEFIFPLKEIKKENKKLIIQIKKRKKIKRNIYQNIYEKGLLYDKKEYKEYEIERDEWFEKKEYKKLIKSENVSNFIKQDKDKEWIENSLSFYFLGNEIEKNKILLELFKLNRIDKIYEIFQMEIKN